MEIALLKLPRNYQTLHDEHARQTQVPGQPNADNAQSEPKPTRPTFGPPSPGWTDSPKMEHNFASAREFDEWVNANAAQRQASRPDQAAGAVGHEAAAEKVRLAGDLQAAKDAGRSAKPQQGNDHDAPAPEATKQEKSSGKAALAEDLKAAKDSTKETDQSRDSSRSR